MKNSHEELKLYKVYIELPYSTALHICWAKDKEDVEKILNFPDQYPSSIIEIEKMRGCVLTHYLNKG